jgi:hypothetical protein
MFKTKVNPSIRLQRMNNTVHLSLVGFRHSSVVGVSCLLGVAVFTVNEKCLLKVERLMRLAIRRFR